jgi:hypothetical protein
MSARIRKQTLAEYLLWVESGPSALFHAVVSGEVDQPISIVVERQT